MVIFFGLGNTMLKYFSMVKIFHIKFNAVVRSSQKSSINQDLLLFHANEKHERMFARIKYLISQKSNISNVYYHNYTEIRIKSYGIPFKKINI